MKADKQHSALEVIKKEQLNRRAFTVKFKAEVVRNKKAEEPEFARMWLKIRGALPPIRT